MSTQALNWAWNKVQGIKGSEKTVLARLADFADEKNTCYPGKERLAKDCCIGKRTVDEALKALESKGLISIEPRYLDDKGIERPGATKQSSNRYRLHLDCAGQEDLFRGAKLAGVRDSQGCETEQSGVRDSHPRGAEVAPKPPIEPTKNRKPSATAVAGSAKVGYRTRKGRHLAGKALAQFEYFWNEFHRGWEKRGKAEAGDAWYALTNGEELPPRPWAAIIAGAKAEAQARAGLIARGLTPKMAEGWLLGRRWEDYEPQADPDPRKPRARPPEPPWYEDISGILAKAGEFGMGIGRNTDCLEAAEFVIRRLEERGADPPPELVQWRDLMQDAKAEEAV